ncbi:MAG: hypothetical protein DHS20C15_15020 [Planctomycetota bacterium]|nr:MAG: hypothetical protein DHS20C15_15020 [Planctomycetota bacterium]
MTTTDQPQPSSANATPEATRAPGNGDRPRTPVLADEPEQSPAATRASNAQPALGKPKVALLRGAYLSQFEMQTYEKMLPQIDLEAWLLTINRFPVDLLKVPYRRILSIDEPFARMSGKLGFYFNLFLQATCGLDYLHLGLVNKLRDTDIVHTMETFNAFSHQGLQAKRKHGCKLVTTCWENRPFAAERFAAKRRMKYEVLREADLHIAITERARQCLLAEGADADKVKVIPAGIDTERFHPVGDDPAEQQARLALREKLGVGPDDTMVLSVAALRWEKGIHDLIHAVKRLSLDAEMKHAPIKLVLAGSGPDRENLIALAERIGVGDRVVFTRFDYDEIPHAYRAADFFALASTARPGWLEQFGYVLPEAMASGLPVVATESGSIPEVVGDVGLIVPPSDFLGMATAFKRLVLDPELREDLGHFARAFAERRYDGRVVAERIAQEYHALMER